MTKYTKSTSTTGLFSTYLRINPDHNIVFNALVVNTSDDEVRDTWGKHFDYAKNVYSNRITYKQNYMSVNQLIGTHKFLKPKKEDNFARLILDWRGSYNLTGSEEPDRRQVVLFYDDKEDEEHYSFNYIDKNENHRFYSELNEREVATKVNLKFVAAYDSIGNNKVDERIVFNIGSDFKSKTRNFDYKQYNYILNSMASELGSNVNINGLSNYLDTEHHDAGGFFIQEIPNGASSYVAKSSVIAQYADAKFKFNKLEIIPGVRFEISEQSVLNRNQQSPSILEKTVNSAADVLPSLIAKYSLSEKNVLRLVGSKTVTRPRFNELAPFQYTLFFAGMKAEGNPELQNSSNYNVDFRYEHYPRPGEMITIGGFYKRIDNPIEQVMKATASGQLMSYANALSANVAGAELEFVRKLSFIYGNDEAKRDSSILNNFAFGMNATYMFTSVQIDTTDLSTINTNSARPLEGASPFLLNLSLRYEHKFENKTKMMLATSYNIFGKRLVNVGSNGIGDSYALPVNSLNLVSKFSFDNNLTVGFKVNNVLNPSIDIVQEDMQNIGETINVSSLKTGIDFSFSLGYTINYNKNKKSK
jgi:TonB-dependent receptor